MANEAQIRTSLQISKGNLQYRSYPTEFKADVSGTDGPTPGAVTVAVAPGTDIDLSELTTPGWCVLRNIDSTNYVTIGPFDPQSNLFYPMLEILPGQHILIRWSRDVTEEYATGTGTVGPGTNTIRAVANNASVVLVVEAFEA